MPDFKQLAEGEKPSDPERFIFIDVIHEPAIGNEYSITRKGLDPDHQPSGDVRTARWKKRTRALELAKAGNVPIIYLSSSVAQTET
jgi:hypothetical protein